MGLILINNESNIIKVSGQRLVRTDTNTILDNAGDTDMPVKVSDCVKKLESIKFNLGHLRTISEEGILCAQDTSTQVKFEGGSSIPKIIGGSGTQLKYDYGTSWTPDEEFWLNFPEVEKAYNQMNKNETKYIYSSSKYSVDIINGSVSINLVPSSTYTDTVNISNIIQKCGNPSLSAMVDVTVKYSKEGKMYVYNHIFSALGMDKEVRDFETSIRNDVILEYISGTIKASPINSKVDECIIESCMVTYGNL